MEELNRDQSSDSENQNERCNGDHTQNGAKGDEEEERKEEKVLQFLDSLDSYLTLTESLLSTLRRGWLDLASARYSMGSSRVSSALFDLKLHPAATTLQVTQLDGEPPLKDPMTKEPHFSLSRWSSSSDDTCSSRETAFGKEELQKENNSSVLRHRGTSEYSVGKEHTSNASPVSPRSPLTVDDQVQKERSKPLSVYGTLVSPKLREAQVSFETALETLVEIANMRSMMLSAHAQIQQEKDATVE